MRAMPSFILRLDLYTTLYDFNNTILPLFTSVPQPEGMPLDQKDK